MPPTIEIHPRFCGPDNTGNGGYSAAAFARALAPDPSAAIEVTLRRPVPLARALTVHAGAESRLTDGEAEIATARPGTITGDIPPPPSFAEAEAMSRHFLGHVRHSFPNCFSCGTARAPGDGLRIFAGRPGTEGPAAAPFVPDPSVATAGGLVPNEVVWAALDCTGYAAAATPATPPALLGRMTAVQLAPLHAGEPCVVLGWSLGQDRRKLFTGTALFGPDGRLIGQSRQVWVTI